MEFSQLANRSVGQQQHVGCDYFTAFLSEPGVVGRDILFPRRTLAVLERKAFGSVAFNMKSFSPEMGRVIGERHLDLVHDGQLNIGHD